jgi:uncharacterized protein with NRDE domain
MTAPPISNWFWAANRDEFYMRPTGRLPSGLTILPPGGQDLEQGGTWMGNNTSGRLAALTNYRNPSAYKKQAPSRGHLVQNYLTGNLDPVSYINNLGNGGTEYNGFNLLAGSCESLYYYSNREGLLRRVEKGIHGLSNSLLDVPWPKVTKGLKSMAACLRSSEIEAEPLFALMADREQPADQDLPSTGVSLELERMLAPAFVLSPDYGTKSTTVLLVDRNKTVRFWERTFKPAQPVSWDEVFFEFKCS